MAYKISPNSLIHCSQCGEDYSATYKRCPFCGAKNDPAQPDSEHPAAPTDLDDTYVFDGQDLFDEEVDEESVAASSRGGKRLAEKPMSNPFANADINWPRVITFVCSLIILVAAMVIVFTVVYPQLRGNNGDPVADNSLEPSTGVSDPAGGSTPSADPDPNSSGAAATDPVTEPSAAVSSPVGSTGLKSFTTNTWGKDTDGFSLKAGESFQMQLTYDPVDWSGTVTYSVSDTRYATVSDSGNVTNVNPDTTTHRVVLTITAGGVTLEMPVYCNGATAVQPPASQAPASQAPTGTGTRGTVVNAPGGLNVRSGPGTNYNKIASLTNGTIVDILETAGGGWYKISFAGAGGAATEGYVSGDYITVN